MLDIHKDSNSEELGLIIIIQNNHIIKFYFKIKYQINSMMI